jgi:hypothetical protein
MLNAQAKHSVHFGRKILWDYVLFSLVIVVGLLDVVISIREEIWKLTEVKCALF